MLPQLEERAGCWCIVHGLRILDAFDTRAEAIRKREELIRQLIVTDLDEWRRWKCLADGREH
ncbi:hypothetical protein [Faecalibaculum rodentium]|uniref:hypothetical protein n=1 Tax=Faecalibaculum rodentium TaxID=1702221 RepID=UPI00272FC248|nr:hypothetical protein [Faecalibaculum rodentium]